MDDPPLTLGYTTYGMPDGDPFEVLPRLRDLGYDAVEFAVTEGWPADPGRLDADDRERLRGRLSDRGFPTPHLMDLSVEPLATGRRRADALERFDATCRLARDLALEAPPVVKLPITGEQPAWDGNEARIREDLLELADVAGRHGVVFAVEPHVGTCFETPDKAAWLMAETDHPHLRLALDNSHFPPDLFDLDRAVDRCGPHAVTTHVKDTVVEDGEFRFRLPGETGLDYERFLGRLVDRGYEGPVTAEVSAQLWDAPGYDPWAAARTMHDALRGAVDAVNRGA